jgi:hypothetical protein
VSRQRKPIARSNRKARVSTISLLPESLIERVRERDREDRREGLTLTILASALIFPQETASSGRAPESEPSYSWPVLM